MKVEPTMSTVAESRASRLLPQQLSSSLFRFCSMLVLLVYCAKPPRTDYFPNNKVTLRPGQLAGEYLKESGRLEIRCDGTFSKAWGDDAHAWVEDGHIEGTKFKILGFVTLELGPIPGNPITQQYAVARDADISEYMMGFELSEKETCK